MRETLYDFCQRTENQTILEEWDKEKNAPLTPEEVSYGSKKKVWWHCPKGHEYKTRISVRTSSYGCPYCSNKKILPEENSLAALRPDLIDEWDAERNGTLSPTQIGAGTTYKAWWRCSKGHSWRASVSSRYGGSSCPVCAGKAVQSGENDLASLFPEIAAQWDAEKNAPLTPQEVTAYSSKRVWWRCPKEHSYYTQIALRSIHHTDCPYCKGRRVLAGFNDLATLRPWLAAEWDSEKNGTVTAQSVTIGSHKKVWWKCSSGHEWQAAVYSRVCGNGCPICSGRMLLSGVNDLATCFPDVAAQWDTEKNDSLLPSQVLATAKRKAWWRCALGHSYCAEIARRTCDGTGCPYCSGKKVLEGFNDLATMRPEVAAQWYSPLNGELTPQTVTAGANRTVWWICREGHIWKARISRRSCGAANCPICNGSVSRKQRLRCETILRAEDRTDERNLV